MKKMAILVTVLALTMGMGCGAEREITSYDEAETKEYESPYYVEYIPMGEEAAMIQGDIGVRTGINEQVIEVDYYAEFGRNRVDLIVERPDEDDAVMVFFIFPDEGLNHPELTPGYSNRFAHEYNPEGVSVYGTACAGPSVGDWSYDVTADEVQVNIQSTDDGMRRFEYDLSWHERDDHVQGFFIVE